MYKLYKYDFFFKDNLNKNIIILKKILKLRKKKIKILKAIF